MRERKSIYIATLASTNLTTALAANAEQPLAFGEGGLICEVFKFAGGGAGDTAAMTPKFITDIRVVQCNAPASDGLSHTAANTSVTLTLAASVATSVTFQAFLIGRR